MRGTSGRSAALALGAWLAVAVAGAALTGWAVSADAHWAERHVFTSYCATNDAEWFIARSVRWVAAALGLITVVVVAPAVTRRMRRISLRAQAGSLVGVGIAIAASLAVTELYMRRLHDRLAFGEGLDASGGRNGSMAHADPRLGWSYFPKRTTWVRMAGRLVPYAIDAEGNRASSADDSPDTARPTILFTGESIAFGYGLPYEETFPFLIGRDLGVQAVNLAVVGYGNDQAYLRVLDALTRYRHPVAVVTVFVTNQIRRNVDTWRPRLGLGPGGALTLVPPSSAPRIAKLLQELPYHGDESLRVTAAVLRATAEAARARGAFPFFVVTNYGAACLRDDDDETWVIDKLFVRQRLPFVRVDLGPEDRLPGLFERHPSLRGTRKIAAAVERPLSERLGAPGGGADRR